jgi:hypothetical protein
MPLRESLPDELIENVADLLGLRAKTASADLSAWAGHMLQAACQRIDVFVEPTASVEAMALWARNGGDGDLRAQRLRGASRAKRFAGLQCESAMPAAQLFDDLIALGPVPSRPRVREVLETAEVVWLTKEQVAGLPRGYRDWWTFSKTLQLSPKP